MAWINIVILLSSIGAMAWGGFDLYSPSSLLGIGLIVIALLSNFALVLSDHIWEPVETLGVRGLTMIDDWLDLREEWIDPVARWVHDCGHLDTRHFMCLRRLVDGPRAEPLGTTSGQWMLLRLSQKKEMCSTPEDMAGGKMRIALERVRLDAIKKHIDADTAPAKAPSRPRPRL